MFKLIKKEDDIERIKSIAFSAVRRIKEIESKQPMSRAELFELDGLRDLIKQADEAIRAWNERE